MLFINAALIILLAAICLGFPVRLFVCMFSARTRRAVRKHWIVHSLWGLLAITLMLNAVIPKNPHYRTRARVAEGISIAMAARTAVSIFWLEHHRFPENNTQVAIDQNFSSEYLESLIIGPGGEITLTYKQDSLQFSGARGRSIVFKPENINGRLEWICTGGDLPHRFRPQNCRQ